MLRSLIAEGYGTKSAYSGARPPCTKLKAAVASGSSTFFTVRRSKSTDEKPAGGSYRGAEIEFEKGERGPMGGWSGIREVTE